MRRNVKSNRDTKKATNDQILKRRLVTIIHDKQMMKSRYISNLSQEIGEQAGHEKNGVFPTIYEREDE